MSVSSHWNAPPPTYDAHSQYTSTLTPYLQLPHLLSLTWLAYPILSLAFVAFRLQLSLASANDGVAAAKSNLLASCKAAERAATSASSLPRYLAIASNEQFADIVNGSMNAARATLVLALTAMEGIINFIIDLYRSTLLCFLELVVRGGLSILISAVNEINDLVKTVTSGLKTSIQNDIQSANNVIKNAIDAINRINPLSDIPAPQIPLPNLDGLENISLPPSFQQALTNLNNSLPTVADLKEKIESIIDQPFELLKKDINDTFGAISFNSSVLPVPQQNLLTFCDDMDLSVVDDVGRDIVKTAKIGIIILIVLALILIGLNCLLEWYKWRCMKANLERTRQAWVSDPTVVHSKISNTPSLSLSDHNLMILNSSLSHPLLTRLANGISRILRLSPSQHTHIQWFFNYIFHPPALACLLIGLIGLLSIEIQLAAVGPLVAKYQERSASTASDFSNTIFTAINSSMYDQSAAYANDVNARVDVIQTTINDGVFGWVNTTTVTLNTTIVGFYDDVQNAVGTVFNGTILENPAREFIRCLIGTKVDAIENALTFLHDNLVINMPRVNQTVLVMSRESIDETTRPIAAAAIGGDDSGNEGLILKLVNSYAESLKKERVMFAIFIGLWGLVVLMALAVIFWHSYGKRLVEMKKRRRWEREQRSGIDGLVVPFRMNPSPLAEKKQLEASDDLPAFTPLPSPKGSAFKPFSLSRSASPAASPHLDSEGRQSGNNWITAFKQRFVAQSNRLAALDHKPMGKERASDRTMTDNEEATLDDTAQASQRRDTAWFGRMASMLDKKPTQADVQRSQLRISLAHDTEANPGHLLSSRWSSSPVALPTAENTPWKSLILKTPPQQSTGLPARPMPRNTPSDVESTYEDTMIQPTPLAPPIHLGFEDRYPRPHPPMKSALKQSSVYPPRSAPRVNQPQVFLAPPPHHHSRYHRRNLSVPASPKAETSADASVTPVTRLLTNTHARKSSSLDPFVTPFDDEFKVTIAHPTHARKSIHTNPFLNPPAAI